MTGPTYAFGRFRLSADGTMLDRDGAVVPLAPKALRTLLVLVEHAGAVVSKSDLMRAVWPDSFVEETGLTRNISLLRQALGDDGERFVVTIARVGYRFAVPVTRVEGHAATAMAARSRTVAAQGQFVVGRENDLNALQRAFLSTIDGRGQFIAITGEPGIGKTTVVEKFLQEITTPCVLGRGRCSERLGDAEPHLPVLEALDDLTTADPNFKQVLRSAAPTWFQAIEPSFARLQSGGESVGASHAGNAERLMRELTVFLEHASRGRPLIIFIDDLHWSDVSTVDVLTHLASRLSRMRLLMVATYRPHELAQADHPFGRVRTGLIARGELEEFPIRLLESDDVHQYVTWAFDDGQIPPDLPDLIFRKTEGNPLFMADLVRYFRHHSAESLPDAHDLPDSLRALIQRMLNALDTDTRQLMSIAAVQGYEFDSATLSRVSGTTAADAEELLQRSERSHALITPLREITFPDGTISIGYRFVHVLYQESLTESIAPSRRIELARRIAESLSLTHAGSVENVAAQLGLLFETGHDFWQASHHLLAASRNAARRFAFWEAADLARRGLHCLTNQLRVGQSELLRRELDLTLARIVPLASVEGYASPEVEHLADRLVELGETLRDVTATATGLGATWFVRMVRGECVAAKEAGQALESLAASIDSDILLMNAQLNCQIACHHLGEFVEAANYARAVSRAASGISHGDRCISIFDPVVASLAESSRNLWITGYLSSAVADAESAVTLGRELRHPDSLAFAWLFHALLYGNRHDWNTSLESANSGIAVALDAGSVQTLAWNRIARGWALAHLGRVDEGFSEFSAGLDASKAIMGHIAWPQFSAMMAELLLLRHDHDGAALWVRRAIELMNTNLDRYFAAELYRLSAVCDVAIGERASAVAHVRTAIKIARSQGAHTFEVRGGITLAELDPAKSGDALRRALQQFPEPAPSWEIHRARAVINRQTTPNGN